MTRLCRTLLPLLVTASSVAGLTPPARAQDPGRTATIYVDGYDGDGATLQGVFGIDRDLPLIDSVAALAGLEVARGTATLPPNAVASCSYYGDTPPPFYTAQDIARLDSVTTRWGGGVPRYALIVARYARDVLRRSGALQVNFVSASFGALVVRWLIEKDVEGLASEGRIARWLSIEGVISGNWAASRDPLVHILDRLDPLPIDVAHMNYAWVSEWIHTPRAEADDPRYAGVLLGHVVSTDDTDNGDALSALMASYHEYQPNDGVQAVADARFGSVTARSRLDGLPPTLAWFHTDHTGIRTDRAAWAQAAAFLTQSRRVTVTITRAQVTDLHEAHAWYWDWRPAEIVLESRVYSPAVATRWGIHDPLSTIAKEGAAAPLLRFDSDGETRSLSQVIFDDLVLGEETQLRLALQAEEVDYDWRYGVSETTRLPYYDDLGSGDIAISTLAPGTYTFRAPSWNCTLEVSVHDYAFGSPLGLGDAPAATEAGVLRIAPNPHGARVRIEVEGFVASGGPAAGTLDILDLSGRRVRRIDGDVQAGILWDGRDQAGAVLPPGIYLHRVTSGHRTWTGRSLLVR